MGQRSDRQEWDSLLDLGEKDYLPGEARYGHQNPHPLPMTWTMEKKVQVTAARQNRLEKMITRRAVEDAKVKAFDPREWLKTQIGEITKQQLKMDGGAKEANALTIPVHKHAQQAMVTPPSNAKATTKKIKPEPDVRPQDTKTAVKALVNDTKQRSSNSKHLSDIILLNDTIGKSALSGRNSIISQSAAGSANAAICKVTGAKRARNSDDDDVEYSRPIRKKKDGRPYVSKGRDHVGVSSGSAPGEQISDADDGDFGI